MQTWKNITTDTVKGKQHERPTHLRHKQPNGSHRLFTAHDSRGCTVLGAAQGQGAKVALAAYFWEAKMRRIVVLGLWRASAYIDNRRIPVESFGYEQTGWVKTSDHLGADIKVGRWHFSDKERAPFHRHNRKLGAYGVRLRALAVRLSKGPVQ